MAQDNAAFLAAALPALDGALAATRPDLAPRLLLAPGVELRSAPGAASLTLASDWNLAPGAVARVGAPVRLTLRAGGDLRLQASLSDGFAGATLAAGGAAQAGPAASYRLVGGADLSAADPMVTRSDVRAGDVVFGRAAPTASSAPPLVLVRSTTGSIEVAAAGDIRTHVETPNRPGSGSADGVDRRSAVRVYTTGNPVPVADTPRFAELAIRPDLVLRAGSSTVGPFYEQAGDIRLTAGGSVVGTPAEVYNANGTVRALQYGTDWWYRLAAPASDGRPEGVAFWSRYDVFAQSVASFGGGDVRIRAGADIVDLDAATPASGYRVGASADGSRDAVGRWWPGGTLDVAAGGDLVGGLLHAGGPQLWLRIGGAAAGEANPRQPRSARFPQLLTLDTAVQVVAQGDLRIGSPSNPATLAGAPQGQDPSPQTAVVTHLAPDARATLLSVAGDLKLSRVRPAGTFSGGQPGNGGDFVPDELTLAAPRGGIAVGGDGDSGALAQRPVDAASLRLLARDDVALDAVRVFAPVSRANAQPRPEAQATLGELLNPTRRQWQRLDADAVADGSPVQLVSLTGDVTLQAVTSFSAQALRLVAARDVVVGGTLNVQQRTADTTLLQAGRDLRLGVLGGVRLGGAGELVAAAGRDLDLGGSLGLTTVGNQDNGLDLPARGAGITLLAGVSWRDYGQAAARGVHLLGGGFASQPERLAVQLEALARDGRLLAEAELDAAAKAFAALDLPAQRSRVAAVLAASGAAPGAAPGVAPGATLEARLQAAAERAVAQAVALSRAATEAAAAGAVSGSERLGERPPVPGSEFLPGQSPYPAGAGPADRARAEARVRERLAETLQGRALALVLAEHAATLPAATQRSLARAVSPYGQALRDFVAARSGAPVDSVADADARFGALPPQTQALFLNQVLTAELKRAGRDAAGGARSAYLRGYDAMDALFTGARPAGRITLSNSQAKTVQGGDIVIAAPGGVLNVGDLAGGGSAKSASEVGIVTVGGGDIAAVVGASVEVNQSRVFTLADGDVMLWARLGDLDAGRGAKTVVGAPPPVVTLNAQGQLVVDTSGSFSGSGIAVLGADSSLDLYAPMGEINAGDAGIRAAGDVFLGAGRVVGADNIAVGGAGVGVPVAPPAAATAGLAGLGAAAAGAATQQVGEARDEEEERRRRQRPRRNLFLDFLGFGRGE